MRNLVICTLITAATSLCTGCAPQERGGRESATVAEAAEPGLLAEPRVRNFAFHYECWIADLKPGSEARVWVPVATDSHEQKVEVRSVDMPADYRKTTESRFGNKLIYFEAKADERGEVVLGVQYHVERREALLHDAVPHQGEVHPAFTIGSRLVPVDGTLRKELLGAQAVEPDPRSAARRVYDAVAKRMKYGKPEGLPWGRGDAAWACRAGVGNCSDFHSLFIGAARDLGIPARFEIGFSIPDQIASGEVAGYHCWARFLADGRWIPVDISEADKHPKLRDYYFGNLTADRVHFTIGRDLQLDPPQQAGPVNFLIYPYVEVDGRPHVEMRHRFRYADVD